MKDGPTHLAHKAEHAVDLETEAIVAATLTTAGRGDTQSGPGTLVMAQASLVQLGSDTPVADQGRHDNRPLARCAAWQVRAHIPGRKQKTRRPVRGEKGQRLSRWRSERCERSFAHVWATGGGRRSWLRGLVHVTKAHVLKGAAFNLGRLLRKAFGRGKPRSGAAFLARLLRLGTALVDGVAAILQAIVIGASRQPYRSPQIRHATRLPSAAEGSFI